MVFLQPAGAVGVRGVFAMADRGLGGLRHGGHLEAVVATWAMDDFSNEFGFSDEAEFSVRAEEGHGDTGWDKKCRFFVSQTYHRWRVGQVLQLMRQRPNPLVRM